MKKNALLFAVLMLVLSFAACGQSAVQPAAPAPEDETSQSAEAAPQEPSDEAEPVLPVPDIGPGRQAVAAVAAEDRAFDLVSVVALVGETEGYTHFAFVKADGTYQLCGVGALPAENAQLEYLGEGSVSMLLHNEETGTDALHTISYSTDGEGNVSFVVSDELGLLFEQETRE